MPNTIPSPNMSLPVPVVSVDPGPDWANNVNSCFSIVDQHTHSPGSGVQITPSGIDINSDLLFNNNNGTTFRSARFQPQLTPLALPADIGCLYEAGVDLYYNDGSGNQIRITQSGSVTGAAGTITGLPSGTASASFAAGVFTFQASTLTPANLDAGSIVLRNNLASSKGLTLSPPNAMGSNYSITLPSLPASTLPVSISASGTMAAAQITFVQLDPVVQAQITSGIPTVQKFLSGSGTYTTPTSPRVPLYIRVRMVGGGQGGQSSGTSPNPGGAGGDSTFGTTLLVAGGAGVQTGGTASLGSGPIGIALSGSDGGGGFSTPSTSTAVFAGAGGSSSPFGGAGRGGNYSTAGTDAQANTGSGGGGGGTDSINQSSGYGGASGGYVDAIITNPDPTYAYSVGAAGAAGAPGEFAGGAGGSGLILVEEFYQ